MNNMDELAELKCRVQLKHDEIQQFHRAYCELIVSGATVNKEVYLAECDRLTKEILELTDQLNTCKIKRQIEVDRIMRESQEAWDKARTNAFSLED